MTVRVYLDANFFISGFSERPKDVHLIKQAADQLNMELWISRQVFHELRWYLRREVETIIQIDETLMKDIKRLIDDIKRPESSLPQPNDMSLILAAMRAKGAKIVTSDMKLLNTIQDLKIEVDGIVGSAFVLELIESLEDDALKKKLSSIRERIYAEEVRYSISRREAYDPVTRIRIIEEHALRVIKTVKRPAHDLDRKLSKGQPLFVLDFLEDIKAGIPDMFDDFKLGRYDTLADEIEAVQNEIERLLIVSTLTQNSETHQALVEHASNLTLFLYYLQMVCQLYRGTREGVDEAIVISDEAFRLLMFAAVTNDELKALVFFVRIILGLIREDYEEIDYYYSLYDGMLDRAGLEQMKETSEGLYVTMQILRKFMGGFSLRKTKLDYAEVTIAMLNDIAKYFIQFDQHQNAWQLSANAYKVGVAYNVEEGARQSFLMLYKVSSSADDKYNNGLEKIAENALKMFIKKQWNTNQITPILNQVQGNPNPVGDIGTEGPVPLEELPEELHGWMDVLSVQAIEGHETLVVFSEKMKARVGVDVSMHPELRELKTGHKIALVSGEFDLSIAPDYVVSNYAVMLLVTPSEGSEISYEGEYGFRYLEVAEPDEIEN